MTIIKPSVIFVLLMMGFVLIGAETKLTYPQRQAVDRQSGTLREVEKKVQDGFAPNETSGLNQKLDNVLADLEKNKCPDDNQQVTDMKNRVKAAREAIAKLAESAPEKPKTTEPVAEKKEKAKEEKPPEEKAVVEKKEIPAKPKEETKPVKDVPPASNEVKLNYQQKQTVDRGIKSLLELEKSVNDLNEMEAKIKYFPAPITTGLGFQEKIDPILKDLDHASCPPANSQVADILQRIEKVKTTIAELEIKLKPKYEAYDKLTNLSNFPNYEKDMNQLKRLHEKYYNPEHFYSNLDRAKELLANYSTDAEFFNALGKTYAPIINFKTNYGLNLLEKMKSAQKEMLGFNEAKKPCGEQMPAEIDLHLKEASEMANKAVSEKKVAFFGGGVKQCMDKASKSLDILVAVKDEKDEVVVTYKAKFNKVKEEIAGMEKTMEEEILSSTMLPAEIYNGSDKEDLRSRITNAWKKEYPKDEVLKVVMYTDGWNRSNKWSYNSSGSEWSQTDMSVITGIVVIKIDNKIAIQYPAYVNKDHLSGDKITMGVGTKGNNYVNRRMLLSNVK